MFDLVRGLKSFIHLEEVRIDNNVFRLHYKLTAIILTLFSIISTSRQYLGDPIDCFGQSVVPQNIMDTFCWITSTFTVPNKRGKDGMHVLAPGVSNYVEGVDEKVYHNYYQWVCFVLFFQAMLFYLPRYIWKTAEGGKARTLATDLKMVSLDPELMNEKCKILCEYFIKNRNSHIMYFTYYVFCEVLNFVNVIGQLFLLNSFLGGVFFTYGWEIISLTELDYDQRIDPMSRVFPKLTKCTFHSMGPSGSMQRHDSLCILPVNVFNEKIYIFLWFWFIILAVISGLAILYRLATILSPKLRYYLLRKKFRIISPREINFLCKRLSISDWFIFYQISFNVDPHAFKIVVQNVVDDIKSRDDPHSSIDTVLKKL